MEGQVKYWLESAQYDMEAAEALYEKGKYAWCLFLGHLVLEKVLKGYYVKVVGKTPPYTHSLPYLAEKTSLKLNEDQIKLLERVDDFHLAARYPDKKLSFYKLCTKEFTQDYFTKIKEFYHWMRQKF